MCLGLCCCVFFICAPNDNEFRVLPLNLLKDKKHTETQKLNCLREHDLVPFGLCIQYWTELPFFAAIVFVYRV